MDRPSNFTTTAGRAVQDRDGKWSAGSHASRTETSRGSRAEENRAGTSGARHGYRQKGKGKTLGAHDARQTGGEEKGHGGHAGAHQTVETGRLWSLLEEVAKINGLYVTII